MKIDRIVKIAFDIAKDRKKRICSVDKANVLEVSQLWRERVNHYSNLNPEMSKTLKIYDVEIIYYII